MPKRRNYRTERDAEIISTDSESSGESVMGIEEDHRERRRVRYGGAGAKNALEKGR